VKDDAQTVIDENQLGKDARGAYAFLQSEYGGRLVERFISLHSDLHKDAESEELTSEQRSTKIVKAAGIKQCIDLIFKEAQLVSSGQLKEMEDREKVAALQPKEDDYADV
jgi:hypothetical protein